MASDWRSDILDRLLAARGARTTQQRGRLYESFIQTLFESITGITFTTKNVYNPRRSQEIDLCFWNDLHPDGLWFLPTPLLVECKNWSRPVGSAEVAWFDDKIRRRGLDLGILFAANGVTGDAADLSEAHDIVARALADRRRLIVITADELAELSGSDELIRLFKVKLTRLHASGTSLWSEETRGQPG
jgi:hypothetical protein